MLRWYHGRQSRHLATSLLMQNGTEGCFLLRMSDNGSGQLTLSVRAHDSVKHFLCVHFNECCSCSWRAGSKSSEA